MALFSRLNTAVLDGVFHTDLDGRISLTLNSKPLTRIDGSGLDRKYCSEGCAMVEIAMIRFLSIL